MTWDIQIHQSTGGQPCWEITCLVPGLPGSHFQWCPTNSWTNWYFTVYRGWQIVWFFLSIRSIDRALKIWWLKSQLMRSVVLLYDHGFIDCISHDITIVFPWLWDTPFLVFLPKTSPLIRNDFSPAFGKQVSIMFHATHTTHNLSSAMVLNQGFLAFRCSNGSTSRGRKGGPQPMPRREAHGIFSTMGMRRCRFDLLGIHSECDLNGMMGYTLG